MRKGDHVNTHPKYICEDCSCIFTVWTKPTHTRRGVNRRPFCPNCGDMLAVIDYKSNRYHNKETSTAWGIRWTPEEVALLDQCIKGTYTTVQLAAMLGRSERGVSRKKCYRLKELKQSDISG